MQNCCLKVLKNSNNFFALGKGNNFDEIMNIDGIGETQIKSIKDFFSNEKNLIVLNELKKNLKIVNEKEISKNNILKRKHLCLLENLVGISRAEAKSLVENKSGKIISNVSKKLNFLVKGKNPPVRKINDAKNLNVKIISQSEFLKMLNTKILD